MAKRNEYKMQGWVARDGNCDGQRPGDLIFGTYRPKRWPMYNVWSDFGEFMRLPIEFFPDLHWEDESIEVELTIRRKDEKDNV